MVQIVYLASPLWFYSSVYGLTYLFFIHHYLFHVLRGP